MLFTILYYLQEFQYGKDVFQTTTKDALKKYFSIACRNVGKGVSRIGSLAMVT
jgi:hypothetical protein